MADELAGHLEEVYEGHRRQGMTEELAAQRAMKQVTDWNALQRHIRNAKEREDLMHDRVRQVWFPGFLTLTLSTGLLPMLLKLGLEPRIVSWSGPETILFYVPWLMTLPLFGALGAYISLRAGGSARAILFSGVFPVLSLAACFFVILPLSIVLDRSIAFHLTLAGFLGLLLSWIAVPGTALLIGALPIQILHARKMHSQCVPGA
ncbi:MAG: hypothetical protein WBB89_09225 [Candidatus Acidiferrum sp.]